MMLRPFRFFKFCLVILVGLALSESAICANSCASIFHDSQTITGALVERPRVLIISAPSGAGKSTLLQRLTSEFPNSFRQSVSTTTRAPRGVEVNGVAYHFTTIADFEARVKRGEFIEYANVHGNYYGTSRAEVEKILASGRSAFLDINVMGAQVVRDALPGQTVSLFIAPPSFEILEQRLRARGTDSESSILVRLANAREEMGHQGSYDKVIHNDQLDRAYGELISYLSQLP